MYPTHHTLVSRCFPGSWSVSGSFYHEFHEWTNGTNLFRFNIREIRLFVSFVISKHLRSRKHNSSTRRLHSRITKEPMFLSNSINIPLILPSRRKSFLESQESPLTRTLRTCSITCGMNHKIAQSAKQRRSHSHTISVLILCNLVVLYANIHTILRKCHSTTMSLHGVPWNLLVIGKDIYNRHRTSVD